MSNTHTSTLSNQVTLATETIPSVQSVGVAIAVPAGVATEPENLSGLSSIVEEMLARGAGEHDSRALADAFDRVGSPRSITTGDRFTMFSTTCLADTLDGTLALLSTNVYRPRLDEDDLAPAKELARAAIASLDDEPRERAAIAARARHFPGPYARCPHGSVEGIDASSIDDARSWWQERNATARTIVSLAGAVTHEHALELVGGLMPTETSDAPLPDPVGESPRGYDHITDPSNQVQIIVISDAPPAQDETAALRQRLCTHVLSGGMSSRLFTEVREKRGLCYTVSASYRASRSLGTLHSYVGTTPERAQESLDVLADELVRITTAQGLVTQDEFDRAIAGMKANVVFHGESTAARASALVSDLDRLGRVRPLDEVTDAIDRLTIDDVNEHASVMSFENSTVQTLGPEPLGLPSVLA